MKADINSSKSGRVWPLSRSWGDGTETRVPWWVLGISYLCPHLLVVVKELLPSFFEVQNQSSVFLGETEFASQHLGLAEPKMTDHVLAGMESQMGCQEQVRPLGGGRGGGTWTYPQSTHPSLFLSRPIRTVLQGVLGQKSFPSPPT